MNDNHLLSSLTNLLGDGGVLTSAESMAPYLQDWRGHYHGQARAVVQPTTVDQVAKVVELCLARGIPMVPQGGNTSLCGGATPLADGQAVVVSFNRLNQIRDLDPFAATITIEAGVTLQQVQTAANDAGWYFPLSLPSEGSCQIGGNISTNAGGTRVIRYGMMRQLVLGLEVVLPNGQVWSNLRSLHKDNSGYDLKQLFIGAEGTLGMITAAVLKLFAIPRASATLLIAVPNLLAMRTCLQAFRQEAGERLTSFEIYDQHCVDLVSRYTALGVHPLQNSAWYALVELSDTLADAQLVDIAQNISARLLEQGQITDAAVAQSDSQSQHLWAWRERIPEAERQEIQSHQSSAASMMNIKHDISVPLAQLPEFVSTAAQQIGAAFPQATIVAFGHFGDGNLHYNIVVPQTPTATNALKSSVSRLVYDLVHTYGGSISAEHGLGQLKRADLPRYKNPVELSLMHQLKALLDPNNLMNPGKVL